MDLKRLKDDVKTVAGRQDGGGGNILPAGNGDEMIQRILFLDKVPLKITVATLFFVALCKDSGTNFSALPQRTSVSQLLSFTIYTPLFLCTMSEVLFMRFIPSIPVIPEPALLLSLRVTYPVSNYLIATGILPVTCCIIVVLWILVMIKRLDVYEKRQHQLLLQLKQQQLTMATQEVNIQEAERKRIAADIHDEIGSNLAAIRVNLESLLYRTGQDEQKASNLLQLVDQTSMNVRRAAHNLIPPLFGHIPLTDILQSYFSLLNSPSVLFHFCANKYQRCFDARQELILYRIVMELTSNVIRHAKATAATIQLLYYPEYLEILVEDDGIGLPPSSGRTSGIGLSGVSTRVNSLGGTLYIDSGISGTTFIIQIPVIPQHAFSH